MTSGKLLAFGAGAVRLSGFFRHFQAPVSLPATPETQGVGGGSPAPGLRLPATLWSSPVLRAGAGLGVRETTWLDPDGSYAQTLPRGRVACVA